MFCERCFRATDAGGGRVDGRGADLLDLPRVVDMRRLGAGDPGGDSIDGQRRVPPPLGEIEPQDVRIAMAVEAVWKNVGSGRPDLDIAYFPLGRTADAREADAAGSATDRRAFPCDTGTRRGRGRGRLLGAARARRAAGIAVRGMWFTYAPARRFCERCFAELEADVELGPGGTLVSFTIGSWGSRGRRSTSP
jgi:hypothetical protein